MNADKQEFLLIRVYLGSSASSSTVAPCFNTRLRAFSSFAATVVRGTTSVVPAAMGLGCETCSTVWISTVRLPCRTASVSVLGTHLSEPIRGYAHELFS